MEDTKERILAAALDLFSEKGYAAVSTKALAQAAKVNEVTLFRSFGSKQGLYAAVFDRYKADMTEALVPQGYSGRLEEDLCTLGWGLAKVFLRNHKIVSMSIKDLESFPEIRSFLRRQPESYAKSMAVWFRAIGQSRALSGDPEVLASTFVTALIGSVLHMSRFKGEAVIHAYVGDFCKVYARGMVAP